MCIFTNVYYIIYDILITCYLICPKLCIYYYYYPSTIILSINHYMFFDHQLSEGPRPNTKISLF